MSMGHIQIILNKYTLCKKIMPSSETKEVLKKY